MIAKFIFAASLCFAFFVMPRFWQHDTRFSAYLTAISAQTDSIFTKNHQLISAEIEKSVRYSPKYAHWQYENDTLSLYLKPLNAFLDKKIAKIQQNKSLSAAEIDSINTLKNSFFSYIIRNFDKRDQKDWEDKFSAFTLPKTDTKLAVALQNIRLRQFKKRCNEDAILLKNYYLEKTQGSCGWYAPSPFRIYTKTFEEKRLKGSVLLAAESRYSKDSVWVNGIFGHHYEFTPRKPGYHYFCVKAQMADEKGAQTVVRDTFRLLVTK